MTEHWLCLGNDWINMDNVTAVHFDNKMQFVMYFKQPLRNQDGSEESCRSYESNSEASLAIVEWLRQVSFNPNYPDLPRPEDS